VKSPPEVVGWARLALTALGLSVGFALILVALRVPGLVDGASSGDRFARALTAHVNLSLYLWTFCGACLLWFHETGSRLLLSRLSMTAVLSGMSIVTVFPLLPLGQVHLLDYVPLIDHPVFLFGLLLIAGGFTLMACDRLVACVRSVRKLGLHHGMESLTSGASTALGVLSAMACLTIAVTIDPAPGRVIEGHGYQSTVWGMGHVLQLSCGLLLATLWLRFASMLNMQPPWPTRTVAALFLVGLIPILGAPAIYFWPGLSDSQTERAFTELMRYGGWVPCLPIALWLAFQRRSPHVAHHDRDRIIAMVMRGTSILFLGGLLLGVLIRDDSTMVPAHYHAVVGATTAATMAFIWSVTPVGLASYKGVGTAFRLYMTGIGLLVCGLAATGFVGLPRKTPGPDASTWWLDGMMLLSSIGGAMAIAGVLIFILINGQNYGKRLGALREIGAVGKRSGA